MATHEKKKVWTEEERLALAAKLDAKLNKHIDNLESKKYIDGWPEDKWEEEMDKHPFFMKTSPKPGDELSPLMEGLQKLKYGEDENTPEELASSYKEDGNFNYKYKKYRLAILSYTEGIKTKCKDVDLMAQLYNNRAAAQFMLKNYRSSLYDSMHALKLKPLYLKALSRAATCSFHIKDFEGCVDYCDTYLEKIPIDKEIIKLRSVAVVGRKRAARDERRRAREEEVVLQHNKKLRVALYDRDICHEICTIGSMKIDDLALPESYLPQRRIDIDENDRLLWPILILYPETMQTDFIEKFHEDTPFIEQLTEILKMPPDWDTSKCEYTVENINVYNLDSNNVTPRVVNVQLTLGNILRKSGYMIHTGVPRFYILVKSSKAEQLFLDEYKSKYHPFRFLTDTVM